MSTIKAFYTDRRGAGVVKVIEAEAQALRILLGNGGIKHARIECDGEIIGTREPIDSHDDKRIKWQWWLDPDYFKTTKVAA